MLGKLPKFSDNNLIVGIETSDDAAVYKVTDDVAMIQTVDFFTPIVDDPYMFGQIAAANALSDVYAMGGIPKVALNIVGFPNCLDPEILGEILRGGADKVKEAGAVLVGGHSVQDDEPKYGLCVSGFIHPDKLFKNFGCKPGDVLILTKQIGSGIVNTAVKAEMASDAAIKETQTVMASLNKKGKEAADGFPISACTDITGFGLLGHCCEMAEASDVTFELHVDDIAFMEGAKEYASMGLIPGGAYNNEDHFGHLIDTSEVEEVYKDMLYDPQTSGGLIFSVPEEHLNAFMERLNEKEMDTKVSVIGKVIKKQDKFIKVLH